MAHPDPQDRHQQRLLYSVRDFDVFISLLLFLTLLFGFDWVNAAYLVEIIVVLKVKRYKCSTFRFHIEV